jgi:hypothetical protein
MAIEQRTGGCMSPKEINDAIYEMQRQSLERYDRRMNDIAAFIVGVLLIVISILYYFE